MNEAILAQILENPPLVSHQTASNETELEALYHAVMTFYPEFGETKVEETATIDEIYTLINEFFIEQDIDISLKKEDGILQPELGYYAEVAHEMYDLSRLPDLKTVDAFSYTILLCCVSVLSSYCCNSLDHHEWWKENIIEWYLEEGELEKEERAHFMEAITLMDDFEELHTDYFSVGTHEENIKYLSTIRNKAQYKKLSPKIKGLVHEISQHQDEWKIFSKAQADDPEDSYLLFTEFVGFSLPEISSCYDNHLHDYLQYVFENCIARHNFIVTVKDINNIYYQCLGESVGRFCGIMEATGTIINEVCKDAS